MSLHQHSKTFSQGQWLSSRDTYECQNLHEYVHEYIVYLSTKFMTFMLVILQSYSVGKFNSTWFEELLTPINSGIYLLTSNISEKNMYHELKQTIIVLS